MQSKEYTYLILYERDPESNQICASVPALDLATHGKTIEEARMRMREAVQFHLEGLIEENMPVADDVVSSEHLEVALR